RTIKRRICPLHVLPEISLCSSGKTQPPGCLARNPGAWLVAISEAVSVAIRSAAQGRNELRTPAPRHQLPEVGDARTECDGASSQLHRILEAHAVHRSIDGGRGHGDSGVQEESMAQLRNGMQQQERPQLEL